MSVEGTKALNILKSGINLPGGTILQMVNVEELEIDINYQRGIVASSVAKIDKNFDENAVGIIQVGERVITKKKYILDGQNRVAVIKRRLSRNEDAPSSVLCCITPNTTLKIEAEMFEKFNTNKPVTGANKFRSRVVSENEPESRINKWVENEGFVLEYRTQGRPITADDQGNGIRASQVLLQCYNKCPESLAPAVRFLKNCYGKPYFVPFQLRHGAVIFGIALYIKNETCKDVKLLVKKILSMNLDLVDAWTEAKKISNKANNRRENSQAKIFARMLNDMGSNGCKKRFAA